MLMTNAGNYTKGVLSEILDFVMGKGGPPSAHGQECTLQCSPAHKFSITINTTVTLEPASISCICVEVARMSMTQGVAASDVQCLLRAHTSRWRCMEGAAAGNRAIAAPQVHREHGGHICRQRPARRQQPAAGPPGERLGAARCHTTVRATYVGVTLLALHRATQSYEGQLLEMMKTPCRVYDTTQAESSFRVSHMMLVQGSWKG